MLKWFPWTWICKEIFKILKRVIIKNWQIVTGGLLCRSNPIDSFGKNQRLEFFSAFLFPVLDRNLPIDFHRIGIFLSLFSSHCSSCDDPCSHIVPTWSKPDGRELPWRRTRRQWAASHTRRTSCRNHCDQPPGRVWHVAFPLHLLVNLGLILTI